MAMTLHRREERRCTKAKRLQEKDLRLKVRPDTKQALAEPMELLGTEEQGKSLTQMIHHLHGPGRGGALPRLEVPRHQTTVSPVAARKCQLADQQAERKLLNRQAFGCLSIRLSDDFERLFISPISLRTHQSYMIKIEQKLYIKIIK